MMAALLGMLGAGSGAALGAGTGAMGAGALNAATSAAPGALSGAFTPMASIPAGAAVGGMPAAGGANGFLSALNNVQQFRQNPLGALGGGGSDPNNPMAGMATNPFLSAMRGQYHGIQQVPANPLPSMGGKR